MSVSLVVSVPVCSFRKGYAREYLETHQVPPPSTLYGFLLSLIGEEDRRAYVGTEIACALLNQPERSTILRTAWHIKDKMIPPGLDKNRRPDCQEILTDLRILLFVKTGPLADRIAAVGESPNMVDRFGGLSLGESKDLVNDIQWHPRLQGVGRWLTLHGRGQIPLPIWVDHVGSKGTVWRQFNLDEAPLIEPEEEDPRWIPIRAKNI